MTLPQISKECIDAVKGKAEQYNPAVYAKNFIDEIEEKNPHLMGEMKSLCFNICKDSKSIALSMAYMGVFYNSIKAQIEANELKQLFNEDN